MVLCERGIRTFETATRFTLDVAAVPIAKKRLGLPVIVDPSHAAGKRDWVESLTLAGVACGGDGLLIETHPEPAKALSDGPQAVRARRSSPRSWRRPGAWRSRWAAPSRPAPACRRRGLLSAGGSGRGRLAPAVEPSPRPPALSPRLELLHDRLVALAVRAAAQPVVDRRQRDVRLGEPRAPPSPGPRASARAGSRSPAAISTRAIW